MLAPVEVTPPLSNAFRYSRATDLRCSSVMSSRDSAMSLPSRVRRRTASACNRAEVTVKRVQRARRHRWNHHRVADDLAVRFLVAAPGQLDEVLAVLDEASAWLAGRGVEQWPSRFEPSWVEGAVRRGETWL